MLTKPEAGWTEFHLEGTHTYTLSYTDRIASDWMGQAIHGLETKNKNARKYASSHKG